MFERIIPLIGEEIIKKIKNVKVLVVGVGGVGETAIEALVRSGISHLTIIDSDTFAESNLNRQIFATPEVIDQSKVEVCQERMQKINPKCEIKTINVFLTKDNIDVLKDDYDYIIDACDTTKTKLLLIKYAIINNIKIISSMGMGKRLNPSLVKISTLDKTYNDPLAKIMRQKVKELAIHKKIPVVFSTELPLNNSKEISSMIFVPSAAGLNIAYYIINDIIKK